MRDAFREKSPNYRWGTSEFQIYVVISDRCNIFIVDNNKIQIVLAWIDISCWYSLAAHFSSRSVFVGKSLDVYFKTAELKETCHSFCGGILGLMQVRTCSLGRCWVASNWEGIMRFFRALRIFLEACGGAERALELRGVTMLPDWHPLLSGANFGSSLNSSSFPILPSMSCGDENEADSQDCHRSNYNNVCGTSILHILSKVLACLLKMWDVWSLKCKAFI